MKVRADEHEGSDVMSSDGINMLREACRILEDIASNAKVGIDERVLAWAKLKAWGHGRELRAAAYAIYKRRAPALSSFRFGIRNNLRHSRKSSS